MNRIRTAVIGCGKVGAIHAEALHKLPESCFVAVADVVPPHAFAERYGVAPYTDIQEMLHKARVEMVSICTPHPTHAQLAIAAAQAGVHVLVEKPMAASLRDCDLMIATAEQCGIKLGVISQRRFYEPVRRVKEAIEAGKIGKPILATLVVLGWRGREYYESDSWRGTWRCPG